jgi:multicomponent Na+:H+ antiporter subunit B
MKQSEIVDLTSRKLAPYVLLFGLYLIFHGHVSPGGGFQGGVVLASGVILLALSRSVGTATGIFPFSRLGLAEAGAFGVFLSLGLVGLLTGASFLGDFLKQGFLPGLPPTVFLVTANLVIGLKVGAGISIMCLTLMSRDGSGRE